MAEELSKSTATAAAALYKWLSCHISDKRDILLLRHAPTAASLSTELKSASQALQTTTTRRPLPVITKTTITLVFGQLIIATTLSIFLLVLAILRITRRARRARRHRLQLDEALQKFRHELRFGIDIGGTLCKLVYYEPDTVDNEEHKAHKDRVGKFLRASLQYGTTGRRDEHLETQHNSNHNDSNSTARIHGKLHFITFPTTSIDKFMEIVEENNLSQHTITTPQQQQQHNNNSADTNHSNHSNHNHTVHPYTQTTSNTNNNNSNTVSVCCTGGGAYKFADVLRSRLHVQLHISDELLSLVRGIDFLLHTVQHECYFLSEFRFKLPLVRTDYSTIAYPYLVVNIGSGVSILCVRGPGPQEYSRVGGTSLGGGTFYGLCRALTGCTSFTQALAWAEQGHASAVDLLVGDIYGGDYTALGLHADTVASSFGKAVRPNGLSGVRKEDLAKALLIMITNNIGSLANLYAHKVMNWRRPQIVFVGNFLNDNDVAKRTLAYATDYWSKGEAQALFLKHEGYFGAVGALC